MALTLANDYPWQPSMPPVCYLCGASPRPNEPIVHTGKYIEMEGFLHICAGCWGEGARLLGWLPPNEVAERDTRNGQLRADNETLQDQIAEVTEKNRLLTSGFLDEVVAAVTPPEPEKVVTRAR